MGQQRAVTVAGYTLLQISGDSADAGVTMKITLVSLLLCTLLAASHGYNWQPVFSDTFAWRPCSAFEATKKNCPRGEPCMADLSYKGWVPNNALKCLASKDKFIYQESNIGLAWN